MNIVRIENWKVVVRGDSYIAPELMDQCLHGNVFGHPKKPDGSEVTTSAIVGWDANTRTVITKSGTHYLCGEIDPEYEKVYPDARQRMVNSLTRVKNIQEDDILSVLDDVEPQEPLP